jgi:hypothetical protein
MTTLYEKRGRRYHPVREYDNITMDSMPKGAHLVVVLPGESSTRYNVNPDHAAVLAALRMHREPMLKVLRQASEMKPSTKLTQQEKKAYAAFVSVMGYEATLRLESESASGVLDALEKSLVEKIATPLT